MFEQLTQYGDMGLFLLRLAVATIFIYHALPKLKNKNAVAQAMGVSPSSVLALGSVEFLSGVGLILGVYVPLAAFLLSAVMVGAIYMKIKKWSVPFSATSTTGWEFDFVLLAANIAILLTRGGAIGFF